jgi:methylated-DNA-[protein]-cysteine S-methyltransferase
MTDMTWTIYQSPLGPLTLIGGTAGLRNVHFPGRAPALAESDRDPTALAQAVTQLDEYFSGHRQTFELDLDLDDGTAFQKRVWTALQSLPYGHTTTYGAIADMLAVKRSGYSTGARKVASAIGATPTPIVIPCHRVIGADGSLTGYLGGLQRKHALLTFEATGRAIDAHWDSWPAQQLAFL